MVEQSGDADRITLARFLADRRPGGDGASGDHLQRLLVEISNACAAIARHIAQGALGGVLGASASSNTHGETQQRLDLVANDIFLAANERGGHLAGMVSEELERPHQIPAQHPIGPYLLLFDPLDGSSNIDINAPIGSIFSVLKAPAGGVAPAATGDFLQRGGQQVCAGYAIYGPSTMLVISIGDGVHAFTLDPDQGEFILTHPDIRVAAAAAEFAINASNSRFWEPPVRHYIAECLLGRSGARGKDFNMRWIASLVAEVHRILMRGGVFLYPRDARDGVKAGRLRLLYEANPVALLIEQAGGVASTGRERILDIAPSELHQRVPFIFGARDEVERIESHHRDPALEEYDAPLFGSRGLFRAAH